MRPLVSAAASLIRSTYSNFLSADNDRGIPSTQMLTRGFRIICNGSPPDDAIPYLWWKRPSSAEARIIAKEALGACQLAVEHPDDEF